MYKVLIVDDEIASIKYIRNLIAGYVGEYQVAHEAFSGQDAYAYLCENHVDLLITDARMPGMDGIELARKARALSAKMKIVVVSGYADFEYAKGAVSAGVNEYLLKPLNIQHTIEVLRGVAAMLCEEYHEARRVALARLVAGKAVEQGELMRLFGAARCRVGMVRLGNLPTLRSTRSPAEMLAVRGADGLVALPGRDEAEWIGVMFGQRERSLVDGLSALAEAHPSGDVATMVYGEAERAMGQLHGTVRELMRVLDERLVMGREQRIALPVQGSVPDIELPLSELRKLDFCLSSGSMDLLKDALFGWAVEWEELAVPQRAVERALGRIMERSLSAMPHQQSRRQVIRGEVDELFQYAHNAGELMSGFWDVLFAPMQASQHGKQQADELLQEIQRYTREHCVEPLTIQSVCVQFGISQTYLSRLFRKFDGTTFNEYLTKCRLDVARKMMLEQPMVKLRDVARLSGYEDSSYFSKVFRQHEGMTPQQYAAEHQMPTD